MTAFPFCRLRLCIRPALQKLPSIPPIEGRQGREEGRKIRGERQRG